MVAIFFGKNLSRCQVVAMKVLIKKKSQVKTLSFVELQYKTTVKKKCINDELQRYFHSLKH